jgi:hypothetical protein
MLPTLVRTGRRTLERGWRSPRKGDGRPFHARPGQCRDVGPVRRVSSITTTTPSRALRRHPRHCGGSGRQDAATPTAVRPTAPVSCTLESAYGRRLTGDFNTTTLEAALGRTQDTP